MSANNRKCLLCGTEYEYCPTCGHKIYDLWKVNFCSRNCKDVYQTVVDFNCESKTAEETKEILKTLDLSKKDQYKVSIKESLNKIYKEENQKVVTLPKKDEAPQVSINVNTNAKENNLYSRNKYTKAKYGKR